MDLQNLKLNRLMSKTQQAIDTQNPQNASTGASNRQVKNLFQNPYFDPKDARQILPGTVITNCIIQTSALPNRVELSGNDAIFYDYSNGGTGTIEGDTATIKFTRSDGLPGDLIMQKRHGVNDDRENVFEIFYAQAASGSQRNYIFIGRQGDSTVSSYTDTVALHGVYDVRTEINRIFKYNQRPTFYTYDYNKVDGSKQGVNTYIASEGKDGTSGIGKLVEVLIFSGATSFAVGDTITGNATGATARLIYKISSSIFYADHTNSIAFNPATDNACTTNGAGGGTGTGDLSSTQFAAAIILSIDPSLNIIAGGHILPDTTGVYNIGSPSLKFANIYGAIVACPLPTIENALEVIRKIPEPTYVGDRGHFGDGLYFDDLTFPKEVMHKTKDGDEIEHTRMIGLLMQAVRELTSEVDNLRNKLDYYGIQ